MVRQKVKLAFIDKKSARKATFRKRRKGLVKKMSELVTLVGTRGCLLIYPLDDDQPTIWPSEEEVREYVLNFRNLPETEQSKNMLNQDMFMNNMMLKQNKKLEKMKERTRKLELCRLIVDVAEGRCEFDQGVEFEDVLDLRSVISEKLKDFDEADRKEVEATEEAEKEAQAAAGMMEMASWLPEETPGSSSSGAHPSDQHGADHQDKGKSILDESMFGDDDDDEDDDDDDDDDHS